MSMQELHCHAQLALAFKFPPLVNFFTSDWSDSFAQMIFSLNALIGSADAELGCPFKAVSYHGQAKPDAQKILHWEMIVDV
jgi:hypothetical protein